MISVQSVMQSTTTDGMDQAVAALNAQHLQMHTIGPWVGAHPPCVFERVGQHYMYRLVQPLVISQHRVGGAACVGHSQAVAHHGAHPADHLHLDFIRT